MKIQPAALLVVLGVLASCARPPPPPPPPPPAPPPLPAKTVDGLYRGTSTRFRALAKACPYPGLVRLEVLDRSFRYRLNGVLAIDVMIDPDGKASGQFNEFTLAGQWTGNKIEGDITSEQCGLHFRAMQRH
jgi:hypothetical protein